MAEFEGLGHQVLVAGDQHADTGAAGGESLGDGVNDDHVVVHALETAGAEDVVGVIDELAVDLVADQVQVVFLGDLGDHLQLLLGQHVAGRVLRVDDCDRAGILVDQGFQLFLVRVVVVLLGDGGHRTDHAAGSLDEGVVVGIEGLGHDHFGAGIQDAEEEDLQGLTAAGRDQNVLLGVLHADAVVVVHDCFLQGLDALGVGVGENLLGEVPNSLEELGGCFDVGLADIQLVDLLAGLFAGHRIRRKFPHGREGAAFGFFREFHTYPPNYSCFRKGFPHPSELRSIYCHSHSRNHSHNHNRICCHNRNRSGWCRARHS